MEKTVVPHNIYAESTPNPATMKFVSNRYLVVDGQVYEYGLDDDLDNSPLAAKLLNFPFISKVFIASNFVAITKTDIIEWQDVIHQLRDFLGDFLAFLYFHQYLKSSRKNWGLAQLQLHHTF